MRFGSQKNIISQSTHFKLAWKEKKKQIYELVDSNSSKMKRQPCRGLLPHQKLRRYLLQVVSKCKRPEHSYSATMLKTNALFLAKELVCNDFRASNGWLDRWKKRKDVSFKKFLGTLDMFLTLLTEYVHKFWLSFKYQDIWYFHSFIITLIDSFASNAKLAPMILTCW